MSDWVPFDYDLPRDAQPLPSSVGLVWIYDEYYHGVTLGCFDAWWRTYWGSDDIKVSHWMPLDRPPPPAIKAGES